LVTEISVAGRKIGPTYPCFIIAEAGVNHGGSLEMARQLIDMAVRVGADAVKFQTFKADAVVSDTTPKGVEKVVRAVLTCAAEPQTFNVIKYLSRAATIKRCQR
jgi:N-acetylneuraminate synthase/N,N'-diacetyllegionaminate synthase